MNTPVPNSRHDGGGCVLRRYITEADNLEGDMFRIIDRDGDGLIGEADLQSFMVLAAPCDPR